MNNSKKLRPKKVKEIKTSEKPITSLPKPLLITSVALIIVLIGGLLFDQLYEATLMTIDGKKYNLKDLSYYFYTVESTYNYYDQMLGGSYWNTTYDSDKGTTMRDKARQDAIDQCVQDEILYNEAVTKGYKLTSKEKDNIKTQTENMLSSSIPKNVIEKNHFTKAYLTKILGKITLAQDYRNNIIDTLKIDDAAIKAKVDYNEYKQYDIEYITIPTQSTDANGKTVALTDAQKKAAYEKISAIYDKAKSTDDWSKLLTADEKELSYHTDSFIKSDSTFSDDFKTMMMKMENKQVSDIYEDTTGYYIVRMINNNSSERYDSQVKSKITEAEDTAFNKYFTKSIKPNHKYKLNEKALNKLKMGTVTLASTN